VYQYSKGLKFILLAIFSGTFIDGFYQETVNSGFKDGAGLYSSYIFRGIQYGTGPVVKPLVKYTAGSFNIPEKG
jgi:hypothetical protein